MEHDETIKWHPAFFDAICRELREVRGYAVREEEPGIYRFEADGLPAQIIEARGLIKRATCGFTT